MTTPAQPMPATDEMTRPVLRTTCPDCHGRGQRHYQWHGAPESERCASCGASGYVTGTPAAHVLLARAIRQQDYRQAYDCVDILIEGHDAPRFRMVPLEGKENACPR